MLIASNSLIPGFSSSSIASIALSVSSAPPLEPFYFLLRFDSSYLVRASCDVYDFAPRGRPDCFKDFVWQASNQRYLHLSLPPSASKLSYEVFRGRTSRPLHVLFYRHRLCSGKVVVRANEQSYEGFICVCDEEARRPSKVICPVVENLN